MLSLSTYKVFAYWKDRGYKADAFQGSHGFFVHDEIQVISLETNSSNSPLSLGEIIVEEWTLVNYKFVRGTASQSSTVLSHQASNAVYGSYGLYAITDFYTDVEQWWMVKYAKLVFVTSIEILCNGGMCRRTPQDPEVTCTSLSGYIQIKTSVEENPPTVTLADSEQWSLCYTQDVEPFFWINVECNRNEPQRFVRHLSVQPKFIGQQINLRAVDIFGKLLPQFPDYAREDVKYLSHSSLSITFPQWFPTNIGAFKPTSYKVELSGIAASQTFPHNENVGYIYSTWHNLTPGVQYTYTATCQFRGWACPGRVLTGSICPGVVAEPQFAWSVTGQGGGKRLTVTSIVALPNCQTFTVYKVVLRNSYSVPYQKSWPNTRDHIIERVPTDVKHDLTLTVTNSQGNVNSKTERIPATADVPDQPEQEFLEFNSSCVRLKVKISANDFFQKLLFQISCSSPAQTKNYSTNVPRTRQAHTVFCGFPSNTPVDCEIKAENYIGMSNILRVTGSTTSDDSVSTNPVTSEVPGAVSSPTTETTHEDFPGEVTTLLQTIQDTKPTGKPITKQSQAKSFASTVRWSGGLLVSGAISHFIRSISI